MPAAKGRAGRRVRKRTPARTRKARARLTALEAHQHRRRDDLVGADVHAHLAARGMRQREGVAAQRVRQCHLLDDDEVVVVAHVHAVLQLLQAEDDVHVAGDHRVVAGDGGGAKATEASHRAPSDPQRRRHVRRLVNHDEVQVAHARPHVHLRATGRASANMSRRSLHERRAWTGLTSTSTRSGTVAYPLHVSHCFSLRTACRTPPHFPHIACFFAAGARAGEARWQ